LARLLRLVERFVYARAAHLLVITEGAKANLVAKATLPEKVTVLPHWYPSEMYSRDDRPRWTEEGRRGLAADGEFIVTFAGNLGLLQGLSTVIDAAAELRGRANVSFRFIGDGIDRPRLEQVVKDRGLNNVVFM